MIGGVIGNLGVIGRIRTFSVLLSFKDSARGAQYAGQRGPLSAKTSAVRRGFVGNREFGR